MVRISFFLLTIYCFLLPQACKTSKPAPETSCQTIGVVKDYTGLDGCKMLIELEDGRKFLPAKIAQEGFILKDNQRIAFDYQELKDYGMTICMAEDLIVELTCVKEINP